MPTATDSKTVLERYVAAIQSRDAAAIRESFAEHAVWRLDGELPISGTWEGRDAIVDEFLATAMRYYEPGSVSIEITSLIAEGEQVVMEWTSRARTTGGKPYENRCIATFTVRDGQIEAVSEYMDTLYAYRTAFS